MQVLLMDVEFPVDMTKTLDTLGALIDKQGVRLRADRTLTKAWLADGLNALRVMSHPSTKLVLVPPGNIFDGETGGFKTTARPYKASANMPDVMGKNGTVTLVTMCPTVPVHARGDPKLTFPPSVVAIGKSGFDHFGNLLQKDQADAQQGQKKGAGKYEEASRKLFPSTRSHCGLAIDDPRRALRDPSGKIVPHPVKDDVSDTSLFDQLSALTYAYVVHRFISLAVDALFEEALVGVQGKPPARNAFLMFEGVAKSRGMTPEAVRAARDAGAEALAALRKSYMTIFARVLGALTPDLPLSSTAVSAQDLQFIMNKETGLIERLPVHFQFSAKFKLVSAANYDAMKENGMGTAKEFEETIAGYPDEAKATFKATLDALREFDASRGSKKAPDFSARDKYYMPNTYYVMRKCEMPVFRRDKTTGLVSISYDGTLVKRVQDRTLPPYTRAVAMVTGPLKLSQSPAGLHLCCKPSKLMILCMEPMQRGGDTSGPTQDEKAMLAHQAELADVQVDGDGGDGGDGDDDESGEGKRDHESVDDAEDSQAKRVK